MERTDQGTTFVYQTRDDGSRTSLRTVGEISLGLGPTWADPGVSRAIQLREPAGRTLARSSAGEGGGDEETRTPDPLLAKEMLCQLSYVPVTCALREGGGRTWTRTRDLGLIRAALYPTELCALSAGLTGQARRPHRNP